MNVLARLEEDLKSAAKTQDKIRLSVLRLLKNALDNQRIEVGQALSPPEILSVLQKEAKKRQDSVAAYSEAGRNDLASEEKAELDTIKQYLPAQLSDEELTKIIKESIKETGFSSSPDKGKLIGAVLKKVAGRADGGRISALVARILEAK